MAHASINSKVLLVAALLMGPLFAQAGEADLSMNALKAQFARPSSVPHPQDNAYSPEREQLGRLLFYDTRLSSTRVYSCATCHNPSLGWADGLPKGLGLGQQALARKTPTVLNLAWAEKFAWDGRILNLEEMSKVPLIHKKIMTNNFDAMTAFLKSVPDYKEAFARAYPGEDIGEKTILKALANYQRMLVSTPASFDRWLGGDEKAIPESAKRGFVLFNGKARCVECHSGWAFTDNSFYDIGVDDGDVGSGAHLKLEKMQHAFKVPTLRDIALRNPYMHNGSEASLATAVEFYNRGGKAKRPSLSRMIKPLNLSDKEQADLVSFLLTLSSDAREAKVPVLPVQMIAPLEAPKVEAPKVEAAK